MTKTGWATMTTLAICLLAGTSAAPAQEAGQNAASAAIAAIDPAITHVRVFGDWKAETAAGSYRAIIRKEPEDGGIRFFVQKIADHNEIISTIELEEIRQDKLAVIGYNFEIDQHGLTLFIETRDPTVGADTTYEVFFEEDGSYLFQPASN